MRVLLCQHARGMLQCLGNQETSKDEGSRPLCPKPCLFMTLKICQQDIYLPERGTGHLEDKVQIFGDSVYQRPNSKDFGF